MILKIDKAYPRDFMQVGRVRFTLKKSDGSLHNPLVANSKISSNYLLISSYFSLICYDHITKLWCEHSTVKKLHNCGKMLQKNS